MTFTASITRRDRKRRLRSGAIITQSRWVLNFREPRSGQRKQLFFERQKDAIAKRDALILLINFPLAALLAAIGLAMLHGPD